MIGETNGIVSGGTINVPGEKINLTLKTNQPSHGDLKGAVVTLSYGGVTQPVIWDCNAVTLVVPASMVYTLSFGKVKNYKKPADVTFTSVDGNARSYEATYLTEKVTVSVSANNGASVEGQVVTVAKDITPDNGVYIQSVDGILYTEAEWDGSKTPNGIAVLTDECRFVMALSDVSDLKAWGGYGYLIDNVVTTTNVKIAKTDYAGDANTTQIINQLQGYTDSSGYNGAPAAEACRAFIFPNGKAGYLPAYGELYHVYANKDAINVALTKCGGTTMTESYYWASTQADYNLAWNFDISAFSERRNAKVSHLYVRAFSKLEDLENFPVTSAPITFKVAHGTEYSVSVNDKFGYATPKPQSFTASEESRAVSMVYKPYTDLSRKDIHGGDIAQNTANCYVVKEAGEYMFPIAYGAAIKNDAVNTEAFTNNGSAGSYNFVNYKGNVITSPYVETDTATEAASVQISIADTDNALTDLGISDGEGCRYVKFKVESVPATGANVVVSVKDADGVIMWNWHIWLWEEDLTPISIVNATNVTYNILPVNLASKWDEDSKTHIKNWFYQFGRPTPLLCPSAYNSITDHASYGVLSFAKDSIAAHLLLGIRNPATLYYHSNDPYNWFSSIDDTGYNLWDAALISVGNSDNDVKKTVYDPCPVGFKMPNGNTFTNFSTTNVVDSFASGWKFKRYSGDTVGVFFPASGLRTSYNGLLASTGSSGNIWVSSKRAAAYVGYFYFTGSTISPQNSTIRSSSMSVRPVQDTDLQLPTHKLTINVSGNKATPSGYEVKVYSVNESTDETTGEVTVTLGDVLATQTTASATHEITWGTKYRIVASGVDGFTAPSDVDYTADTTSRTVSMVYQQRAGTLNPTNGVWIQDIDGYCHTRAEWTGEYTPNGIAVITSDCRFVIALSDAYSSSCQWGSNNTLVSGIVATTNETTAKTDYAGESNTTTILNQLGNSSSTDDAPAAYYCRAFTFPNGQKGYLGAAGEWWVALNNKSAITSALSKCGGIVMGTYYWTSTQYSSDRSWYFDSYDLQLDNVYKRNFQPVRAFAAI